MVLFGEELVPTVDNYTPNENVDFEEYNKFFFFFLSVGCNLNI